MNAAAAAATKLVPFKKYQGLGNDFILVDNREEEEPVLTAGESADLCDRCATEGSLELLLRWTLSCGLFGNMILPPPPPFVLDHAKE